MKRAERILEGPWVYFFGWVPSTGTSWPMLTTAAGEPCATREWILARVTRRTRLTKHGWSDRLESLFKLTAASLHKAYCTLLREKGRRILNAGVKNTSFLKNWRKRGGVGNTSYFQENGGVKNTSGGGGFRPPFTRRQTRFLLLLPIFLQI